MSERSERSLPSERAILSFVHLAVVAPADDPHGTKLRHWGYAFDAHLHDLLAGGLRRPDLVLVSGGAPPPDFLAERVSKLGLDARRAYLVPGPGEAPAPADRATARLLSSIADGRETVAGALKDPGDRAALLDRFGPWHEAYARFRRWHGEDGPAARLRVDDGQMVRLVGLNAALCSTAEAPHPMADAFTLEAGLLSPAPSPDDLVFVLSAAPLDGITRDLCLNRAHVLLVAGPNDARSESTGARDFTTVATGPGAVTIGEVLRDAAGGVRLRVATYVLSAKQQMFVADTHNPGKCLPLALQLPRADATPLPLAAVGTQARLTVLCGSDVLAAVNANLSRLQAGVPGLGFEVGGLVGPMAEAALAPAGDASAASALILVLGHRTDGGALAGPLAARVAGSWTLLVPAAADLSRLVSAELSELQALRALPGAASYDAIPAAIERLAAALHEHAERLGLDAAAPEAALTRWEQAWLRRGHPVWERGTQLALTKRAGGRNLARAQIYVPLRAEAENVYLSLKGRFVIECP